MTWRTTWRGDRPLLEEADIALSELADGVDATSLLRDDDASAEPEDAPWVLHAYSQDPLTQAVLDLLPRGLSGPEAEELEDRDWVAHALEGLGLVEAGPFVLFGKHDAEKAAASEKIKLQVEANQAFGTGHHPTTAGCLEALAPFEGDNPKTVLDIGTGSGVLAMAARRFWSGALIVATDIDATSIEIAKENAATNGIDDILFGVAAGTDADLVRNNGPYELVFANILAGPLKELSADIAAQTASGGHVILAGLLDEQRTGVQAAYEEHGFALVHEGGTARWPVLTLKKETIARP